MSRRISVSRALVLCSIVHKVFASEQLLHIGQLGSGGIIIGRGQLSTDGASSFFPTSHAADFAHHYCLYTQYLLWHLQKTFCCSWPMTSAASKLAVMVAKQYPLRIWIILLLLALGSTWLSPAPLHAAEAGPRFTLVYIRMKPVVTVWLVSAMDSRHGVMLRQHRNYSTP